MGYAVLHIDKARSNDSGNTAHIARTYTPSNVDPSRTRLNRELVQFPANVTNRSEAIEHRIATAGIYRKVAKNQVKALRFILSSSPEDMARIEQEGLASLHFWSRQCGRCHAKCRRGYSPYSRHGRSDCHGRKKESQRGSRERKTEVQDEEEQGTALCR